MPETVMKVVIAGGGVAAIEAVLALRDAGRERVGITLLTPRPVLELKPLTVAAPFGAGREARHFDLGPLVGEVGGELIVDSLARVATAERRVVTGGGRHLPFDALVVATGARPVAAFPNAITFGSQPLVLNGVLADIEEGYSRRIAFVVPSGVCWPLPAYELALMTRRQATAMGMDPEITVVTPEAAPLAVFGNRASAQIAALLDEAGIGVRLGAHASIGPGCRIVLAPSQEYLEQQRVVALPALEGPRIPGLPADQNGFLPVDRHARVLDEPDVYCVGDAANYPIKQGGLATQQADAAALHIAARAGTGVTAMPFRPILRGRLLTGGGERFYVKEMHRPAGRCSETPLWWPPTKVSGRYLTPWIARQDPGALPAAPEGACEIESAIPVDPAAARRAALTLAPLGAAPPVRHA